MLDSRQDTPAEPGIEPRAMCQDRIGTGEEGGHPLRINGAPLPPLVIETGFVNLAATRLWLSFYVDAA